MRPDKIRVLFLDKSKLFSGAEFCLASLCRNINKERFEVFICVNYKLPHQSSYSKTDCQILYRNKKLRWWMGSDYSLKSPRGSDFIKRIIFGIQLATIIRKKRVNICHINLLRNTDILDIKVAKLMGCLVVGHIRSLMSQSELKSVIINLCDEVICTSDFVLNEVSGPESTNIAVRVYDPIDISHYDVSLLDTETMRKRYNIGKDEIVISSIGILDPRKGHDISIRAFSELRKEIKNLRLIIAGSSVAGYKDEEERLKKLALDLSVLDKIIFTGFVSSIVEIYAISSIIFALSKDGEAFGRVPLEAAAAGRVAIATKLGATPELVKDKITGFLVEKNHFFQVAEIVLELLRNRDKISEISKNAYLFVVNGFAAEIHSASIQKIYLSLH